MNRPHRSPLDHDTSPIRVLGLLLCAAAAACTPAPGDLGGTLPPPEIDGAPPPLFDGGPDVGDDGAQNADALVFDVSIDATSLFATGISIDGELRVVPTSGVGLGGTPFSAVTLRDSINDPNDIVGIVGGVFLFAGSGRQGSFALSEGSDGEIIATFSGGGGGDLGGRFILPAEGETFVPGVIGITYEVQSGSRFDFQIDGDGVTGQLDLTGTPLNETGGTDVYIGTFNGSRRR